MSAENVRERGGWKHLTKEQLRAAGRKGRRASPWSKGSMVNTRRTEQIRKDWEREAASVTPDREFDR